MSKQVYIYGLYHPETKELRYIGKANNLNNRLWWHIRDAKGGQRTYKATWIRKLLRQNLKPIISVICNTTKDNWQIDEKRCIAEARRDGVRLTNLTKGGDGILGYSHTEETKEKIRQHNLNSDKTPPNWKGRKQSDEHIRKRVEARKNNSNYAHSEETKHKISANRRGKNLGNTHTLGYKHTDEWKRKASERMKGKNNPQYSKSVTDEVRRKISETKRRQHLDKKPRKYICPNCNAIWTQFDLISSKGNCLTDPNDCGWEDTLEEVI